MATQQQQQQQGMNLLNLENKTRQVLFYKTNTAPGTFTHIKQTVRISYSFLCFVRSNPRLRTSKAPDLNAADAARNVPVLTCTIGGIF